MKTKRRTEITIETHQFLVIRTGCLTEGWCERCERQVSRISLQAVTAAGINAEEIMQRVSEGSLHFKGSIEGVSFICLDGAKGNDDHRRRMKR